jgi:type II secretory pathway pseudopilin PulG
MNTTQHEFLPEDVMAFLDGELSNQRSAALVAHLESCAECSAVAANLRGVSQNLASWQLESAPERISLPGIQDTAKSSTPQRKAQPSKLFRGWKLAVGFAATAILLSALTIPNLLRSRMAANEASAVGSLRTINASAATYANTYGHYPPSLKNLGPSTSGGPSESAANLMDGVLAQGLKSGYLFSYHADPLTGFRVSALPVAPGSTGSRRFFTDQTGIISADPGGILGGNVEVALAKHSQAGAVNGRADKLETLTSPGVARDSNGILHGLGDHRPDSFSIDGQPLAQGHGVYKNWLESGPMIARTVSLSILVKDLPASRNSLDKILARYNGYAASLTVSSPQESARSLQASLRIPALQLAAAVSELKTLGTVEGETQNGEEVTQQHADLVARLKNSNETEQRLQAILQQRTGKMSDVLDVEQEIARVRGEIEQMEAEQKNLEHRVDFAAVDLKLSEEYKAQLNPPAPGVSTQLHNALVSGYRNVADTLLSIVLFFAEFGPVLLLWFAILFLPARFIWRRIRNVAATA